MEITSHLDAKHHWVETVVRGDVSLPDLLEIVRDPAMHAEPGTSLLLDLSHAHLNMNSMEVLAFADMLGNLSAPLGLASIAILAPSELTFGYCRMAQQWLMGSWQVHVSRTIADATAWLSRLSKT